MVAVIAPMFPILFVASVPSALAVDARTPSEKAYVRAVGSKILADWIPVRASKDLEIAVTFFINKDGSVSDVRVRKPVGDPVNELRAVSAVRKSGPFPKPPSTLKIPVAFNIHLSCPKALHLTVQQALQRYGREARAVLQNEFRKAKQKYPPKKITLVAVKDERLLLMYAGDKELAFIQSFPLVSYSGELGPKLREGDMQIPEGIYRLTGSSAYDMLSLAVNYPNPTDRRNAVADRRTKLGGSILIHGGSVSTGCVVISNEQMQHLFVAVHDVGLRKTKLIIVPCDLSKRQAQVDFSKQPTWLPQLYANLKYELSKLPKR